MRIGLWAFFLDCAFRVLIGWSNELRSRGLMQSPVVVVVVFFYLSLTNTRQVVKNWIMMGTKRRVTYEF